VSTLNLNSYNFKKIDTTYQNVGFLFNLENIHRSSTKGLGHLEVNEIHHIVAQNRQNKNPWPRETSSSEKNYTKTPTTRARKQRTVHGSELNTPGSN